MVGYFRDQLEDASRREPLGCMEDYRRSVVPLIVPITLVVHKELALRNHV
jgi:uncharacterized protein YbgA (DUF1722 family)